MELVLALAFLIGFVACSNLSSATVNGKIVAVGATATDQIDIHHDAIPT